MLDTKSSKLLGEPGLSAGIERNIDFVDDNQWCSLGNFAIEIDQEIFAGTEVILAEVALIVVDEAAAGTPAELNFDEIVKPVILVDVSKKFDQRGWLFVSAKYHGLADVFVLIGQGSEERESLAMWGRHLDGYDGLVMTHYRLSCGYGAKCLIIGE